MFKKILFCYLKCHLFKIKINICIKKIKLYLEIYLRNQKTEPVFDKYY